MATSGPEDPGSVGEVRPAPAQRKYRIAAEPHRGPLYREPEPEPDPEPPAPRRSRHLRDLVRGGVTIVLVVGLLGWLHLSKADRFLPDPVTTWATGAPNVPVPADAASTPLGRPAAAPAGDGGYAFLMSHGDRPVAFDPCRPVHYVVRYEGAPPGAEQLVQIAFDRLSAATGLVVVLDGVTDEAPSDGRSPHQPERYGDRWAPVLVAWESAAVDAGLAGETAGYATPLALNPDGRGPRLVTGQVVLDVEHTQPEVVTTTLLHELGHLAGLDHVDDPAELMHEQSVPTGDYTPGALRGLHQLGQGPCFG